MRKLFKNSKQILAFVMAFVVIAASFITGAAINVDACDLNKIDYWDGTLATAFESGSGTEADPYIIATAEQLAYCCLAQTPSTSSNVYYEVSDDVKTFVMQPESVVDLNELLALENPEAVNDYFTNLDGKVNWISKFNGQSFNGHFNGNGATIYGLYATTDGTTREDVGLFPQYDGGTKVGSRLVTNTCENIAIKNSYFYSKRRLGAIVGACYGTNYGAKVDGKLTIASCAVVNSYMSSIGSWNYFSESGVVIGGGGTDIIELKSILVKDVYAYNTEQSADINIIGNGATKKISNQYPNVISDSIILGTAPYGIDYCSSTVHEPYAYTNVVTDFPSGKVDLATPTSDSATTQKDYTDHIFCVTETGAAFKAAADMLDWNNTWFMGANGPELRVFHGNIELTTTKSTHLWTCEGCGLESAGGETEHSFVLVGSEIKGDGSDVYMCSECEYICQHNDQTVPEFDEGDCVTASGTYSRCKLCDWYIVTDVGGAPGHKLTYVAADIGDCEVEGHKEYWQCSECNKKFTSNDEKASMDSAVSDEWLNTGYGPHIKAEDESGVIVLYDKNGHWYKCSVNDGRLDADSNAIGEDEYIKHTFKNAVCTDCGYKCTEHEYVETGEKYALHSCDSDEVSEIKCTLCGYKSSYVSKKASHTIVKVESTAPDDRMEGNKEHYKCSICKAVYADAEGKIAVTQASLIIPKVLPEEYRNMVNADTGSTSPSTGDNFAALLPMAALASVALVIVCKKCKQ